MRGIISYGGYVPYRRLDRSAIAEAMGSGGGRGTRSVASFDEDTTSMGVEAARLAVAAMPESASVDELWFSTTDPAYVDRTNANTIHAALRLDSSSPALDMVGSVRSGVGALRTALNGRGTTLVVTSDIRIGLPTSGDETNGGDGAAALAIGEDGVIAELIGTGTVTDEFVDRWRKPGESRSKLWEERFGEQMYVPAAEAAWNAALKSAELSAGDIDVAVVTGLHGRSVKRFAGATGATIADDLSATVGNTGAAHPALLLASVLDNAEPGQVIALAVLSDGAEVLLFRTTDAIASYRPARPVASLVASGGPVPYNKFLTWRGLLTPEPPRRPEPDRPSSSAAHRGDDWKYAFVASRDRASGIVHMPPQRVGIGSDDSTHGGVDDMEQVPMADVLGTVVTSTVDRLAYSPSPPIVFAVVDFDGGGRMPIELTDVEPDGVAIGTRVEMTFRRLFTADGIHNYFWKARPVRGDQG